MKTKTLIAVAIAGAFAVPLAAQASADGDRMIVAQAGGAPGAPGGASSGPGTTGGAAAQGGSGAATMSGGQPGGAPGAGYGASSGPGTTGGAAAQGGSGAERSPAAGTSTAAQRPDTALNQFSTTDMQQMDADRDNYISREEADRDPRMKTRFSELDKDNDGRISKSEWDAGMGSAATGATGTPQQVPTRPSDRAQPATGGSGTTK